jgi:hypothetical protein
VFRTPGRGWPVHSIAPKTDSPNSGGVACSSRRLRGSCSRCTFGDTRMRARVRGKSAVAAALCRRTPRGWRTCGHSHEHRPASRRPTSDRLCRSCCLSRSVPTAAVRGTFALIGQHTGPKLRSVARSRSNRQCAAAALSAAASRWTPNPSWGGSARDTLHRSSSAAGSAAQFNGSISAMPPSPSRTFASPLPQGTADTLPLRWATLPSINV